MAAYRTLEAWRPSLPGNATGERFGPGPPDAILLSLCPSALEAVGPGVDPDGVCEEGPENPVPEEGEMRASPKAAFYSPSKDSRAEQPTQKGVIALVRAGSALLF